MIVRNEDFELNMQPGPEAFAPPERVVYVDIETTGLKASAAYIYLLGIVYYEGGFRIRQYFAEDMSDEEGMLRAFMQFICERKAAAAPGRLLVLSYNGDTFDLPFIKNTARQYAVKDELSDTVSIDLFRRLRPYKAFTGLPDLKLKTVEKLLGIYREDKYSGGDLIYVYEEYVRMGRIFPGSLDDNSNNHALRKHLFNTLILHNAEDIMNLPYLLRTLSYESLLGGGFCLNHAELTEFEGEKFLELDFRLSYALPQPYEAENEDWKLSISEKGSDRMSLLIKLYEGELKYFFEDYKNYYYLINEDYAVHCSIGEFVDKKARKKATRATCYQKRTGLFVPVAEELPGTSFYKEYKGCIRYAGYKEDMLSDETLLKNIALGIIRKYGKNN